MQSGHSGIEKQTGNDQRRRPFARQPRNRGEDPQQLRHDSNMKTGDGEEMQRSRLLERLFDVFRRLMPQAKRDSAEKILDLR